YGVTVNAIAPAAFTRLTADLGLGDAPEEVKEAMSTKWISPIAVWLASEESSEVTGRVFDVRGELLAISESWHQGPKVTNTLDPSSVGPLVEELMGKARPNADMLGLDRK
ncbi:MAG: short-chain dehydrogenase, partial [Actinomycetia bacterium]|nr:short-chain dehydrogenase [Actinomycetes bacterium]